MESLRYTTVARALHWTIAALVAGQFALGWWMQSIPKAPPGPRADAFNLHKSVGLAILVLMAARILWRARHAPPSWLAMPAWQRNLARANHALLYVLLVMLPVTGYLGSVFSGYPVKFFGLVLPRWGSAWPAAKDLLSQLHQASTWLLAAAVVLHLAGAVHNVLTHRDGLLGRMGPRAG
ncbi:MAG TPA: cytochrome b [Usitatibacter sp.]|jgi:cytochrome b561|nr:cytochrome b [Usitatibacter sp.]